MSTSREPCPRTHPTATNSRVPCRPGPASAWEPPGLRATTNENLSADHGTTAASAAGPRLTNPQTPPATATRPKMLWDLSSLALGQILSIALGFAGFAYLGRALSPETYGLVEYAV